MELSTEDLLQIFCVTPMTVYNWRKGIDKKKTTPLPYHTRKLGSRHRVFFKWGEVKRWATQNSVEIVIDPKLLITITSTKK